jgi:hypothetical protein
MAVIVCAARPAPGRTVWHVDDGAAAGGDGKTWATAFPELREALVSARAGDEIRVAGGTYRPDYDPAAGRHTGDRGATFELPDGVAVLGGYAGLDAPADPDRRDPALHATVLSGDLAGDDGPDFAGNSENSFHVVTASAAGPSSRLDGLTITAGNADGEDAPATCFGGPDSGAPCSPDAGCPGAPCVSLDSVGAGLICFAGSPVVTRCRIVDNFAAFQGAGMMLKSGSDLLIADCLFAGNRALDNGGAMYMGGSSPAILRCTFEGNSAARYAGAICHRDLSNSLIVDCRFIANTAAEEAETGGGAIVDASSSPMFVECAFEHNVSFMGRAGALYNKFGFDPDLGGSNPLLVECTFTDNTAMTGGAVYNEESGPTLSRCAFRGNDATAGEGGGAIWNAGGGPTIEDCTFVDNAGFNGGGVYNGNHSRAMIARSVFRGNRAVNDNGGGISNVESDVLIAGCTFSGNSATGEGFVVGGGVSNYLSSPTVTGCVFEGNTAGFGGGGLYNENAGSGGATVTRCAFLGNAAPNGGGIYNFLSSPLISDCLIAGNDATGRGGGVDSDFDSSPLIRHCTIVGNHAGSGGGMNNDNVLGSVTVWQCIVWGNAPDQIADDTGTPSEVAFSDVEGGWGGPGEENMDRTPGFHDPGAGDWRLVAGSPCVDAGDPAYLPGAGARDLAGNVRVAPGSVKGPARADMGAYELQPACPGDLDGDGRVGIGDLLVVLGAWGRAARADRAADLDGDGSVGDPDLVILLGSWGFCS